MASGWAYTSLATPGMPLNQMTTIGVGPASTMGASGVKNGWLFIAETTDAITQLGYCQAAVTGTSPTYKISLQSVSSGVPSGTIVGGGSPASATFTPSGANDGTFQWVTLDNSYSASLGDLLAIVIEYDSGTIDGSNNTSFYVGNSTQFQSFGGFPKRVADTGSGFVSQGGAIYGYATASRKYGRPVESASMDSLSTSGNREALAFTFTPEGASAYTLLGANFFIDHPASGNVKYGLWNTSNTLLASKTLASADVWNAGFERNTIVYFDTAASLTPGTKYYIGYEADGNAFEFGNSYFTNNDDMEAWTGATTFAKASYNGSTWSETTTQAPMIQPIIGSVTGKVDSRRNVISVGGGIGLI